MVRKYISIMLIILTVIGCLSGCGESDATNTNSPTEESTSAQTSPTENTTPVDGYVIDGKILNFFYMDAIQQQYSTWSSTFGDSTNDYLKMYFALDTTRPLNQQIIDQENALTWADYFIDVAKNEALASYAIYELAKSQEHKLSAGAQEEYDSWVSTYETYAQLYGVSADELVASGYGTGATFEDWKAYLYCIIMAQDYSAAYADSLDFDEATLRETEKGREAEFSTYSYATYHLSYNKYPQLGTDSGSGSVSFDDAQKKAALENAYQDALSLTNAKTVDELNEKISGLACNKGATGAVCEKYTDKAFKDVSELIRDWITDPSRKIGDCTVIANETVSTNEDGSEVTTLNGYYTVLFTGSNDNKRPLANVRHLVILSENDDAAAKKKIDELFAKWQENPTEDHFIALTKEHSADSSAKYGGLYEDLAPNSPYVAEFLGWSLDETRQPGDCEIIKTQYGYHIMYYVSDDEVLYRDLLISQELAEKAYNAWYDQLIEEFQVAFTNEDAVQDNYIISPAS